VLVSRFILRNFVFRYKQFLYEKPKNPSLLSQIWFMGWSWLRQIVPPRLESCNSLLPSLPVPPLEVTVKNYLKSVKHLLPRNEFNTLSDHADDFLCTGWWLQLYTRLYSLCVSNYATPLWEKYVYLMQRDPLLINSSVAYVDVAQPPAANQAVRAAHLVYIAALNMLVVAKGEVKPPGEGLAWAGHYKRLFANVRLPGREMDRLVSRRLSRHVVSGIV